MYKSMKSIKMDLSYNRHTNIGKVLDVGWIGRPLQAFPPLEPCMIVSHHTAQALDFFQESV